MARLAHIGAAAALVELPLYLTALRLIGRHAELSAFDGEQVPARREPRLGPS